MKLYKLTNKIGDWWVIAEHPTQAEEKLLTYLNEADYGFSSQRVTSNIELIATSAKDIRFLSGHFLIIKPPTEL